MSAVHCIWVGQKEIPLNYLENIKKLRQENPLNNHYVWLNRGATKEELKYASIEGVFFKHIKELHSVVKNLEQPHTANQSKNLEQPHPANQLYKLALLEADTTFGKAFANNMLKELILYLGIYSEDDGWNIVRDIGTTFYKDRIPTVQQIFLKQYRQYDYYVQNRKTPVIVGKKGSCGLIYEGDKIIPILESYAKANWSNLFTIKSHISLDYQFDMNGDYKLQHETVIKFKKDLPVEGLLSLAYLNIQIREIWAKRFSDNPYSSTRCVTTSTRHKELSIQLKKMVDELDSLTVKQIAYETLENKEMMLAYKAKQKEIQDLYSKVSLVTHYSELHSTRLMRAACDEIYSSCVDGMVRTRFNVSNVPNCSLNYDEGNVENNRGTSWIPGANNFKKLSQGWKMTDVNRLRSKSVYVEHNINHEDLQLKVGDKYVRLKVLPRILKTKDY
ncbi:hypothetical protein [Allofrancisella frigidaquae]|uniref:Uncharacterized protein n=1 Tax=Allofrancisella frigidaquae TaxID=1085644 RepID=A0A6M3HRQ3_9GAMM|nr:hypothetical protein [Allofrancisella frigidaquae]QIV93833.1 hypothetical protein E3E15_00025 [Allofrancisella frigidaquae]